MKREELESYLLTNDLSSYDPYDIWKTTVGQVVRKIYYKNRYFGLIPAGVLTVYDQFINNRFRIGYKKQEFPITRAQAALSLLSLYKQEEKTIYLEYAKKHIDWLLANHSQGYHGYCWGINFDWVYSANDTYSKNIPFSTHTPYPLEAMVHYYKVTKDESLLEPIKSLFLFLENDIKVMQETEQILILSYGIQKDRIVANSNTYIMYMYAMLLEFFPQKKEYIENKIVKMYNFLSSVQKSDGSWLYSPYEEDTFIDCFHSAFILKNIIKTDHILPLKASKELVDNGYTYIMNNFLDKNRLLFKRFSKSNKISLTKFDLYDNAEMLNLSILMKDRKTTATLAKSIEHNFITKDKKIASMINLFGSLKNINHLRWAVLPYLYAQTKIEEQKICVE